MGKLSGFRYREVAKVLRVCGFALDRQASGSHEIWFNDGNGKYTTVPNHNGDMPEGTLRQILKQTGIEADDFLIESRG